jgi:hypothetical protein
MASIDVGIHPDPARISAHHFPDGQTPPFSLVRIGTDTGRVDIFVHNRDVLEALQAALDEIRADMDAAAPVCPCAHAHALCSGYCHANSQDANAAAS